MEFGQKMKFREIDLFDFTSCFGLDFFKYSGPPCGVRHGFFCLSSQLFVYIFAICKESQWARKFKKVQAKKLVKSNKSISSNFF